MFRSESDGRECARVAFTPVSRALYSERKLLRTESAGTTYVIRDQTVFFFVLVNQKKEEAEKGYTKALDKVSYLDVRFTSTGTT